MVRIYFIIVFLIIILVQYKIIKNVATKSNYPFINRLIWNNKSIIPQVINENVIKVIFTHENITFPLFIRSNDIVSDKIKKTHRWPDCISLYKIWKKHDLWKYNYFIDVGANIGACSLFMLHNHIKVISFEPIQNNLHILTKSLLLNNIYIKNITLFMIGLSNETADKTIYIKPNNWGGSSLLSKSNYPEKIKIYRLDDIKLNIKDKIGMMKIDIECSELNMIKGAIRFIKEHFIKIIHFEQLCVCNGFYKDEKNDIYEILESLDYIIMKKLNCKRERYKDIIAIKNK